MKVKLTEPVRTQSFSTKDVDNETMILYDFSKLVFQKDKELFEFMQDARKRNKSFFNNKKEMEFDIKEKANMHLNIYECFAYLVLTKKVNEKEAKNLFNDVIRALNDGFGKFIYSPRGKQGFYYLQKLIKKWGFKREDKNE